jgi:hypothetical protein
VITEDGIIRVIILISSITAVKVHGKGFQRGGNGCHEDVPQSALLLCKQFDERGFLQRQ